MRLREIAEVVVCLSWLLQLYGEFPEHMCHFWIDLPLDWSETYYLVPVVSTRRTGIETLVRVPNPFLKYKVKIYKVLSPHV